MMLETGSEHGQGKGWQGLRRVGDVHAEAYAGKAANLYVAGGQGLGSSRRVVPSLAES